jgi:hypothetical protein
MKARAPEASINATVMGGRASWAWRNGLDLTNRHPKSLFAVSIL